MRIKDSDDLYSNWSDFSSLTLSEVLVVTDFVASTTVTSSRKLPGYISALIGMTVAVIIIALVVLLVLLCCKLKRRRKDQRLQLSVSLQLAKNTLPIIVKLPQSN